MRHKIAGRKFSMTSSHRKAMFANLATNLLEHGQIKTTLPKAKDLRRVVEPLITKAKKGDIAARRQVGKIIRNDAVLKRLFDVVAPKFAKRDGGYTRIIKAGHRLGDAADMAIIELTENVGRMDEAEVATPAKKDTKAKAKAPAKKAKEKKAKEKKAEK